MNPANPASRSDCPVETTAFIGLGANLCDRASALERALAELDRLPSTHVCRVSSFWETSPVGGPAGQPDYLNAAAAIRTGLTPDRLLQGLLEIERTLGRVRAAERNGPRVIDLDLLLFGNGVVVREPALSVPHPRLRERAFVLWPLSEIAPDLVLPGDPPVSVSALARRVGRKGVRLARVLVAAR